MPVLYDLVPRKKPGDKVSPAKFYGCQQMVSRTESNSISAQIAKRSGLSEGNVQAILADIFDSIEFALLNGMNVELGSLGILRVHLECEGMVTKEEVTPAQVFGLKFILRMSKDLKKNLQTTDFIRLKKAEEV